MSNFPQVKISLDTSEDSLATDLFLPCLKWADRYDRGVGFFSTGWLSHNLYGLSNFAIRGGKIRLIASPVISNADYDAIISAQDESAAFKLLQQALLENAETLAAEMEKDLYNTFAWMIHDGIIDVRFAVPKDKLATGIFHDKFGIFYQGSDALSFSGSLNDSSQGYSNFESIKVFKTWMGTSEYVEADIARFERLWNKKDKNIKIYSAPEGVKEKIFQLRTSSRPYQQENKSVNKWIHQDIAVEKFIEEKHGVLAMATGTGKTITAIKIIQKLIDSGAIKRVVISMSGNDLLDQWAKQMRATFSGMPIYLQYGSNKELGRFLARPDNAILLISSDASNLSKLLLAFERLPFNYYADTLFIFDEVHGIGSSTRVENLSGMLSPYTYRLGLSATPDREYDEEGNAFIEEEIGPVIYSFGLEDAIKKGILCPFNYIPLPYELTDEERQKKKGIIASFNARRKNGELVSENDLYTQLSYINKTAEQKLIEFKSLLASNPNILKKCLIFVQSREYGEKVQSILLQYPVKYHTYYAEDEKSNLEAFASGALDCLLTCKKVSEGIDISRVANIVLFSSDRSRLVTTQRIGRALRLDSQNPSKVASVVDFILETRGEETDETADVLRKDWLSNLSKVRSSTDEE